MENNFFTLLEQSNNIYKKSVDFAFKNQKISHAFLLKAEINTKLDDAAYYLALKIIESYTKKLYDVDFLLNGKYMDFLELKPINNTLKKEQVTEATKLFSKSSFHTNSPKILYISNIEKGNSYSLNSLLKYLENPPKNTFIIMSTNNYKRILSTIISRSQIFEIKKKKFEFLEKLYKSENFDNSIIRFYAKIFDDKEEAKSFNSKKY